MIRYDACFPAGFQHDHAVLRPDDVGWFSVRLPAAN